jgi:phosphatidylglycerol---prolipoprotein diacylglyceryl transferase
MILSQIIWSVNPEIFSLGPISVRYYGLFWALSFYIGYEILLRIFKKESVPVKELEHLLIFMAVGSIVGARLGHCFFYAWDYYSQNLVEIFYIWEGGLASHGGAFGIILALFAFQKYKSSQKTIWTLDRIVIPIALAAAFIRLGNLMNSEIYGIETSLSWGFIFETRGEVLAKHPTQIYEALAYFALFGTLLWLYIKKGKTLAGGMLSGIFALGMFISRFLIEFIKEPQENFEADMMINMGQILSIPMILTGVVLLVLALKKKL